MGSWHGSPGDGGWHTRANVSPVKQVSEGKWETLSQEKSDPGYGGKLRSWWELSSLCFTLRRPMTPDLGGLTHLLIRTGTDEKLLRTQK